MPAGSTSPFRAKVNKASSVLVKLAIIGLLDDVKTKFLCFLIIQEEDEYNNFVGHFGWLLPNEVKQLLKTVLM